MGQSMGPHVVWLGLYIYFHPETRSKQKWRLNFLLRASDHLIYETKIF